VGVLGIRREDKSPWERRTPLVPDDVGEVVRQGLDVLVQSAPNRCFADDDFRRAGARIVTSLEGADVVLGVKEIPLAELEPGKTYLLFSHTIKGQPHNMPMLRRMLELGCSLLDYELVTDDAGVRTIAFGRHAGIAGALDALWLLGRRFEAEGIRTPLARLRQTVEYRDLAQARDALADVGREIAARGLPREVSPLAIAVTGEGGKVWSGALEILERLPARRVAPADLRRSMTSAAAHEILVVSYGPADLVEPVTPGAEYSWEHYRDHPDAYRPRFGRDLESLTAVIHGIFWREGYPRFILREDVAALWSDGRTPRFRLVADVSCDLGGSDECLVRTTDPGNPAYVFDPLTGEARDGWEGRGPVVLAVDILPSELPVEASRHFSRVLSPLVPHLLRDAGGPLAGGLPPSLRRSLIAERGRLLPPWDERLASPLRAHGGSGGAAREVA
jgi:alpha-aminoadipic semialdehyde synthase